MANEPDHVDAMSVRRMDHLLHMLCFCQTLQKGIADSQAILAQKNDPHQTPKLGASEFSVCGSMAALRLTRLLILGVVALTLRWALDAFVSTSASAPRVKAGYHSSWERETRWIESISLLEMLKNLFYSLLTGTYTF